MNLGYKKITEYSSNDLPYVICNVELIFGILTSPKYQTMLDIQNWAGANNGADNQEMIRLAADVIQYVITPNGEKWGLGTVEGIEILIAETDLELVRNVLFGWTTKLAIERLATKKKSQKLSEPLRDNVNGPSPAKVSSIN